MKIMDKKTERFTEIYNNYYPLIFSRIYSKTNDCDEAEDICHELFARLYVKYDTISNAGAWLLSTLNYIVVDYYKKKGKNVATYQEIHNDVCTFDDKQHDTQMVIEEALENIDNYMDYKDAILFVLISIYSYTYKEAGKHFGLTASQVRYRYNIGMKKIEEYLNMKGIRDWEDLM